MRLMSSHQVSLPPSRALDHIVGAYFVYLTSMPTVEKNNVSDTHVSDNGETGFKSVQ